MNEGSRSASQTARRVAAQRLTFQRVEVDYGDPHADERLANDVAQGVSAGDSPLRAYLKDRTRFFDGVVVDAIKAGIGQIVIGAAGYDGRAWRYHKPGVAWFEIDHPSTQRDKLRRLASLGIDTSHVRFVAVDFSVDPIVASMIASGFSTNRASLLLLEGVAVYLDRSTLDGVLQQFHDLAAPGSTLAISLSVSTEAPGAAERRSRFQSAVAAMGEPALSIIEPHEVDSLLGRTGWKHKGPSGSDSGGHERRLAAGFIAAELA
ncbi:MAG TPA: SAM-dependent methyltransferase [Acidimicrobiales bacterium]|nr:SAM-dependent methyltransferase [Acidimicrobiales bacterium]